MPEKTIQIKIRRSARRGVLDEIYGMAWHKLNDDMHRQVEPEKLLPLIDILQSVDGSDPILTDFEQYSSEFTNKTVENEV